MSSFVYTAKRSVIPSHTAGNNYGFNVCLRSADTTPATNKIQQQSLSGLRETLYWNDRKRMRLSVGHFEDGSANQLLMLEFLDSVLGGETFAFDQWGSVGADDNPLSVIMLDDYSADRAVRKPGPKTDLITYSFEIEFI